MSSTEFQRTSFHSSSSSSPSSVTSINSSSSYTISTPNQPSPIPPSKKPLLYSLKSLSKRKKHTSALDPGTSSPMLTARSPTTTTNTPGTTTTTTTTASNSSKLHSSDTFSNLSHFSNNPKLRTRNPSRKRHSILITPSIENDSKKYSDLNVNNNAANQNEEKEKENDDPSSRKNRLYKLHMKHTRSASSLIDFTTFNNTNSINSNDENTETTIAGADYDNDEDNEDYDGFVDFSKSTDSNYSTTPTPKMLKLNVKLNSKDYSNTLNEAFQSFNSQLNSSSSSSTSTITQSRTKSKLKTNYIPQSQKSNNSISKQKHSNINNNGMNNSMDNTNHPLRKLIINSPNKSTSSSIKTSTTNSTLRSNLSNHSTSSNVSFQQQKYTSDAPSPLRCLHPLEKRTSPLPQLHMFKPDLSNGKPHIVSISNFIFFETQSAKSKSDDEQENHPSNNSQTSALDVFETDDGNYNNVKLQKLKIANRKSLYITTNTNTHYDYFNEKDEGHFSNKSQNNNSNDHIFLSSLSTGLVDPDLFTQNASSVFSHSPNALPEKHRTSLYFV